MRFISRAQAFKKSVIKAESTLVNTPRGPEQVETKKPYIAFFSQGGATNQEVQFALERFQFKGLGERENPARRISIYDTDEVARAEGWTPEFKAEVEANLVKGQSSDYFLVEIPRLTAPWPSYDDTNAKDILSTATAIGVDLAHVLAYERENENRPEVVSALEGTEVFDEVEIGA